MSNSSTTYGTGTSTTNISTAGGTPTPNIAAQKGGFLSDLFGKSYKGGNFWETPFGKGVAACD